MAYQAAPVYTYQYASAPYYVPFYYDQSVIGSPYTTGPVYNQAHAVQPYQFVQAPYTGDSARPYVAMTGSEVYYAPYSPAGCVPAATEAAAEDRSKTPTPQSHGVEESNGRAAGDAQ